MASKRERSTNFDDAELQFLFDCVAERVDVIENKKTDGKSTNDKSKAWSDIAKAFALNPDVRNRDEKQLFTRWKNLKGVAKKVVNEFRASEAKTGGGKTEVEEPTQLYWDLYNLLRSQFDRIICNVDSDAVASKRSMASDEKSSASVSPHDNSSMSQQSPSDNFNTQEIVTTKPPLQPAAKKICVLPEGVRTDREEGSKTRLSLLEYQKDCLRREHEARMDTIKIEKAAAFAKLEYYQAKKASLMQYDTRYSTVNLNSTVNGQNSSFLLLDQQPFCPGPI